MSSIFVSNVLRKQLLNVIYNNIKAFAETFADCDKTLVVINIIKRATQNFSSTHCDWFGLIGVIN